MLAAILIVLLFVLLGLGVFFIALRGGGRGAAPPTAQMDKRGARMGLYIVLAIVYLGFGVALPLLLITGNHSNASAQVGGLKLTPAEKLGRYQFGQHCGVCHTLAAANAAGKVGPNLDELKPSEQTVLNTIENGCLQVTPSGSSEACLGYGVMPADVVQGPDARNVAAFVARVAGNE